VIFNFCNFSENDQERDIFISLIITETKEEKYVNIGSTSLNFFVIRPLRAMFRADVLKLKRLA